MEIPKIVESFHQFVVETASEVIEDGTQHHPLLFIMPEPDQWPEVKFKGGVIVDMVMLFDDLEDKNLAAAIMRDQVARSGYNMAAFVNEAWAVTVPMTKEKEKIIEGYKSGSTRVQDDPNHVDVLIISIELKGIGGWFYSHPIVVNDAGQRVLDECLDPGKITPSENRFTLFPVEETS